VCGVINGMNYRPVKVYDRASQTEETVPGAGCGVSSHLSGVPQVNIPVEICYLLLQDLL
jgi:hypothetical protein